MSQAKVVANLPSISIGNINEAVLAANRDSTISLVSSDDDDRNISCYDNEDGQPTISVINSSDVVIGSVTQFHGPVTIVQHLPSLDSDNREKPLNANKAHLVTGEIVENDKKPALVCLPKKILLCFALVTLILLIIVLTLIFAVEKNSSVEDFGGENSNRYNLTGHVYYTIQEWGGRQSLWVTEMQPPVRWIIVSHTAGLQCTSFTDCSQQMQLMQNMHVTDGSPNIGYNFVVGGDANVYEGRGWFEQNFHIFDRNSIAISFTGNYVFDELSPNMVDVLLKLIKIGVELKILHPDYKLVAHNQTMATLSPGANVYRIIRDFPNFYQYLRPRASTR